MPKGKKEGFKQSVTKARDRKRKSKFKGVQKQCKTIVNPDSHEATSLTFVCDDDVVSELVPPPPPTISSQKLPKRSNEDVSSEEDYVCDGEKAEGYRIISIESLRKLAIRIHKYSPCASGNLIPLNVNYFVIF